MPRSGGVLRAVLAGMSAAAATTETETPAEMGDTTQQGYPGLEDVPVGPAGWNGEPDGKKREYHWYHLFTDKPDGKPMCNTNGMGYDGGPNVAAIRDTLQPKTATYVETRGRT